MTRQQLRRPLLAGLIAVGLVAAAVVGATGLRHHCKNHPGKERCETSATTTVPGPTTIPAPGSTTTAPPAPGGPLKPRLAGIVDDNGQVTPAFQGVVKSFTLNIAWSAIEPTQGSFSFGAIDAKLAAAHNAGQRFLLRVEAGIQAPGWALTIGGPPVTLTDPQGGGGGPVGRWWMPAYQSAYSDLMHALGARYDSAPELGDVINSECQTIFAECFHLGGSAGASALHAAGLTDAIEKQTILTAADNVANAFPTTVKTQSLVNYQDVDNGGASNNQFTVDVATAIRAKWGKGYSFGWNGIRDPILPLSLWQQWIADNPPSNCQTATPARIGNPTAAVNNAAQILHCSSLEISGDGQLSQFTPSNIVPLNAELVANAVKP